MVAFGLKASRVFCLCFLALSSWSQIATAQFINGVARPTVNLQSATSGLSVGGNATYMTRLSPSNVPLFFRGTDPLVSANQFDFDFDQGYEAFLSQSFDGGGRVEFKFSSLDSGTAAISSSLGLGDFYGTTPPSSSGGIVGGEPLNLTLDARILSGEVNFYLPLTLSTDWSIGLRWISYDETMMTTWTTGVVGDVITNTNVDNHMYGLQTGLDTLLTTNDIYELSIYGKGGGYVNNADHSTSLVNSGAGVPLLAQAFNHDLAATVDFGIKGKLRLTDNIAINFGYSGLYLAGIALAPDQFGTISAFPGWTSTRLDTGSAFYHGGFLGLSIDN